MRELLSHLFTEKALRAQEPLIIPYVDLLMTRIREKSQEAQEAKEGTVVLDMVAWYSYAAFDVIGDLSLGESFHCLKDSTLHPWIATMFRFMEASAYLISVRYYPRLESLLLRCIPKRVLQMQADHYQRAVSQIDRRINLETQRADFMTDILKHNHENGLSIDEIRATLSVLIMAGSETVATALSGITSYLVQDEVVLQKLVSEVRSSFGSEKEMTVLALKRLPYLNAVIEEGLRLCPPVPFGLPRITPTQGAVICGHRIPESVSFIRFFSSQSSDQSDRLMYP